MPNGEDLYGGDGPTLTQDRSPDVKESKKDEGEAQTYLVNKDICPGMKVGDELKGRIVAEHEKEYECEYQKEGEAEEEGGNDESMVASAPEGESGGESASMYG